MRLSDIMTKELVTCSPNESIAQAAQKMQDCNIGLCPVVEGDRLVGVVTDRDITIRAVAKGKDVQSTNVSEVMTADPITAEEAMEAEEVCEIMSEHQIRRLPVMRDNKLIGIIALADLALDLEEEELVAEVLTDISQPA